MTLYAKERQTLLEALNGFTPVDAQEATHVDATIHLLKTSSFLF